MNVPLDQWRYKALAHEDQVVKYTLMATNYDWDLHDDEITVIGEGTFPWLADEWFIVPKHLAQAYLAAVATVDALRAQIEAHRMTTGHTKRIARLGGDA